MIISANEIKLKGISSIEELLRQNEEVFISVRGRKKFTVLTIEEYEKLKELELEKMIKDAEDDYKHKRYKVESADEHFRKLKI